MAAAGTAAISITPDVFGPNGENYTNNSADQDMANIGIDIIQTDESESKKCEVGKLVKAKIKGRTKDGALVTDTT